MGKRMVRYVSLLSPLQFLEKSESRQIIPVQWSTDHLIRTTCLLQTIVVILFFPLSQKSLCASFFLPVCHPWPWGWMSLKPHISFFVHTVCLSMSCLFGEIQKRCLNNMIMHSACMHKKEPFFLSNQSIFLYGARQVHLDLTLFFCVRWIKRASCQFGQ